MNIIRLKSVAVKAATYTAATVPTPLCVSLCIRLCVRLCVTKFEGLVGRTRLLGHKILVLIDLTYHVKGMAY